MTMLDARHADSRTGAPSFSLGDRMYRAAWALVWLLLAAWTPPPLRRWRILLLRLFGARVDATANVYGSARIWSPRNLEMGARACLGARANAYTMGRIVLEPFALISQDAYLCAGTHDIEHPNFQIGARPVRIGAHAWVAAGAFVGPGVTIGEGAVLGARGCAMRDLDPWTVYSGNPARALRARRVRFGEAGR